MLSDLTLGSAVDRARVYTSPRAVPAIDPPPVTVALRHAARDPERAAVADGITGERLPRGELAARSAALAAGLGERGIGRGDLVAISLPNSASWPVAALGVWRAGAAVVPLSPFWTADETARVLDRIRPGIALADASLVPVVRGALSAADLRIEVAVHGQLDDEPCTPLGELLRDHGVDPLTEPRPQPTELAAVLFSSGTGGLPKGVRLTHANLAAGSAQLAEICSCAGPFDEDSVVLAAAPFFHAMGLTLSLCTPLVAGAQIVTMPLADADRTLELAARHGVTHAALRPPVLAEIAAAADVEHHDTSRLRFVATGGAHTSARVARRVGERLGCVVRQGYGMTEALISGPMARPSDPETVGWLGGGTEARLVDPETQCDVEPGQPGELWVRGPQLMDGYYDDPEATAAAITPDGWLRTGDLVSIREDGQLVVEDRLKELIKVNGFSVAPAELELVLCEHPSVRDAAVVGYPDHDSGEVPVAFVVLAGPATTEQLSSYVSTRVAAYKRLHDVRFVDELPRLPSGKLVRRVLRESRPAAACARGA